MRSDVDELGQVQADKLRAQLTRVAATNPFYRDLWRSAGVDVERVAAAGEVRALPFIAKSELLDDQAAAAPFGRRLGIPVESVYELTLTSGTSGKAKEVHAHSEADARLRGELTAVGWSWAGVQRHHVVVPHVAANNAASLWCMVRGIRAVGRLPYLVGHLGFDERLATMAAFGVHAMFAMPSALTAMATRCDELGIEPKEAFPDLRVILTSGESWPVAWAERMQTFWGARIHEVYGSTQTVAAFGAACCERGAVVDGERAHNHLFEWSTLYEVLVPGSDEEAAPGEQGELVLTHLDKEASPLIRFRTGDLVRWYPAGTCPCGRPYRSLETGTVGRIDDMLKVRGQNIWPSAIDPIVLAHPEVDEFQVEVRIDDRGRDVLDLALGLHAVDGVDPRAFAQNLTAELRAATGLRFDVRVVDATTLPHFDSPDHKPRRWRDDRHAGLAG